VSRADLPREVQNQPLDYDRLIMTLDIVVGESVIVRLSARGDDDPAGSGLASVVGTLKHEVPARYEGHEFSVGSPYPDRYPEHLGGGVFFLNENDFTSASLRTFDGNAYFAIGIETRFVSILIQDGDSTYP
jgi:hypothetical protein